MQDPESFCVLPFIHTTLNPFDPTQHSASALPCCRYPHEHTERFISTDQINKSDTWKTLQDAIDNKEKLSACNHCWRDEASGLQSYREVNNKLFKPIIDDNSYREKKLRYLELMFGNTCNLACRSCSSVYSSKWQAVDKYLLSQNLNPMRLDNLSFPKWRDLDLTHLTSLKLMGGEPFYQKTALELLQYLDDNNILENVNLQIPTNGTIELSDVWINLLNKAKLVNLFVSVDAYGELNNYIREGSDWHTITNNITKINNSLNNTVLSINTVVTNYNVNVLSDLSTYLKENFPSMNHYQDLAYYPDYLDIALLPAHIKDRLLEKNLPEKVIEYIKSKSPSEEAFAKLKTMTMTIDKYHKKCFSDYNKEMYDWIFDE
jgi:organic radical activating enzyme